MKEKGEEAGGTGIPISLKQEFPWTSLVVLGAALRPWNMDWRWGKEGRASQGDNTRKWVTGGWLPVRGGALCGCCFGLPGDGGGARGHCLCMLGSNEMTAQRNQGASGRLIHVRFGPVLFGSTQVVTACSRYVIAACYGLFCIFGQQLWRAMKWLRKEIG